VRAGQQRQPHGVDVFLQRGLRDLLGRLVQARVDDLEPVIAQGSGDGLRATIVPVETRFGDNDSIGPLHECVTLGASGRPAPTDLRRSPARLHPVTLPRTPRRSSRSPLRRALTPVLGGIAFFALLGGATWGIAAYYSDNPEQVNDRLAATVFDVGNVTTISEAIAESGPLLFPDLMRAGGTRAVVLDHTGDDPRLGWRAFYAFPADRDLSCKVRQVERTRQFIDCAGRTLDVGDLAPPPGVNVVVANDVVTLDLQAAVDEATTETAPGTDPLTTTSEAP